MLPKMSAYRKKFDETKNMLFLIKDNKLLEKYTEIYDRVSNNIKKRIDTAPVYNENYWKTKIQSHEWKINTNFQEDEISKKGSHCIYLSVILIDSVFPMGKNYYLEVFLECKHIVKEKEVTKYINEGLKFVPVQINPPQINLVKSTFSLINAQNGFTTWKFCTL